jgi:hypothetical protein
MSSAGGRGAPSAEWDASAYHRVSDPQVRWGREVLRAIDEESPLRGGETAIDAGCGTGRLTAELLDRLPAGRVFAVDRSPSMLAEARRTLLPRYAGRVSFVEADLLELPFERTADLVFSTATFHWVSDHPALFARIHRALAPGGRLVAAAGRTSRACSGGSRRSPRIRGSPRGSPASGASTTSRTGRRRSAACAPPASSTSAPGCTPRRSSCPMRRPIASSRAPSSSASTWPRSRTTRSATSCSTASRSSPPATIRRSRSTTGGSSCAAAGAYRGRPSASRLRRRSATVFRAERSASYTRDGIRVAGPAVACSCRTTRVPAPAG